MDEHAHEWKVELHCMTSFYAVVICRKDNCNTVLEWDKVEEMLNAQEKANVKPAAERLVVSPPP